MPMHDPPTMEGTSTTARELVAWMSAARRGRPPQLLETAGPATVIGIGELVLVFERATTSSEEVRP